jgi:predicted transcriptional regulator
MLVTQESLIIESRKCRSKLEIDMAILKATQTPIRISALMYATAVNCITLKQRLAELENKGLVQSQRIKKRRGHNLSFAPKFGRGCMYQMTKKGTDLLVAWNLLQTLYSLALTRT